MSEFVIEREYMVDDDSDVLLTVAVGNRQLGGCVVELDGIELDWGEVTDLVVGRGLVVRQRQLVVMANVVDINPSTNRTAVTYHLTGGVKEVSYETSGEVGQGQAVWHKATISLV